MSTRTSGRTAMAAGAAAVAALAGTVAGQPPVPGFHWVGFAPSTDGSWAYGLSADGRVAAGHSGHSSNPFLFPGFTWTADSGRLDFGLESGLPPDTAAYAVSGDGTTVAGDSKITSSSRSLAYRYGGPGTFQTLGVFSGMLSSHGTGVSGDGSVVVGWCEDTSGFSDRSFRWTQAGGMQELLAPQAGNPTLALGISRNGLVAVGYSINAIGSQPCVWIGGGSTPVLLPMVSGTNQVGVARSCNWDGSIIVGNSGTPGIAAIWRSGEVVSLGTLAGWTFSAAYAVSDDGGVVGGRLSHGSHLAAVWTAAGPMALGDYLLLKGVLVPEGWTLTTCTGVSGDGLTFSGYAQQSDGGTPQGFVATTPVPPPCPADFDQDGRIAPSDVAAFVNVWFFSLVGGNLAGDFDGNGQVQPADVGAFVSAWFNALTNGC